VKPTQRANRGETPEKPAIAKKLNYYPGAKIEGYGYGGYL